MALYKQNVSQIQLRQALKTMNMKKWVWVPAACKTFFSFIFHNKRFHLSQLTICLLLILMGTISVQADGLNFKHLLRVGEQMKYRHWNVKKNEVTGYTIVTNRKTMIDDKPYLLVLNQNHDQTGELYLEKKSWFEFKSGQLSRYTEKDFRTGIEITNTFENKEIATRINTKGKVENLSISAELDLVPFEVLTLHLRKELPRLLKDQRLTFVLYLPIIASELSKKGLPLSLSKLSMSAGVESTTEPETVIGRIKTVQILVTPDSLLISALLPEEKSEFRFLFGIQPPHYLMSFEEGETRSELIELTNLKK